MTAKELFQAGKIDEAIEALGGELRSNPADTQRRTFLFELLCFAGNWSRAEKQLDVLGSENAEAAMGMLLLRSALHAEQTRQQMFETGPLPFSTTEPGQVSGTLNGQPFQTLVDGDPRIGPRLEVFAAGQYMWIPFAQIASVKIAPPKRLRDLLWPTAIVRPTDAFKGGDLGEVLLPALAPLTWKHPDGPVRLGRVTEWQEIADDREAPVGQKLLLVDDQEIALLEIRELEITPVPGAAT
ncbi:MAG: type VI secretion system accessory protein TagJ [Gemmatimonadota bacterium]